MKRTLCISAAAAVLLALSACAATPTSNVDNIPPTAQTQENHQSPQKRSQEAGRVNLPPCFASSFAIAITNPATVLSFLMAFVAFEITGEQTRLESVQHCQPQYGRRQIS